MPCVRTPIVLVFLSLFAGPALGQGMVKYRTPDGKIGFASPDLVPQGATVESKNYRPSGKVTVQPTELREAPVKKEPVSKPTIAQRRAREEREERARERWSSRARKARRELSSAERDFEHWRTRCRGVEERRSLYEVPPGCSTYERGRLDAAENKLEEARDWADDGLFDACRRAADCLPGYIR